jgi:hypothetical protein
MNDRIKNERIKELADKIWAEEYWDDPNTDKLLPVQLNKFAELIVQECAEFADEHNSEVEGVTLGVGNAIKQHFGVEGE